MPSLRDIRRRITSVKKTQQITRAMRMVAGAKLRRAEQAVLAARPYTDQMREALAEVARAQRDAEHPLLVPRAQIRNVELLVVSSDRGLCGAFNANVIKHADRLRGRVAARPCGSAAGPRRRSSSASGAGRLAACTCRRRSYERARDRARSFTSRQSDECYRYNEFVNAITQRPREVRLLPFAPRAAGEQSLPFEIEPSPEKLLEVLVPKAVETEVYRALLENQSGEHAARMAAMESATRNTEELISSLTLSFNRARQAAITKELMEIVSGAEAL
jgi:F-type H+-transporting ATPase subunit gamma